MEQQPSQRDQPITEGVQARKCHVPRADHQGYEIVSQTQQGGDHYQKYHGGPMHGEKLIVRVRVEEGLMRSQQLPPDGQRLCSADQQEESRGQ